MAIAVVVPDPGWAAKQIMMTDLERLDYRCEEWIVLGRSMLLILGDRTAPRP